MRQLQSRLSHPTPRLQLARVARRRSTRPLQATATAAEIEAWRNDAMQQVEAVVAQVQREPAPDPYHEEWIAISTRRLVEPHNQKREPNS